MGNFSGYKIVPLGFKTTVSGTFTITAEMLSSLTANGNYVWLKDNVTTTVQNLHVDNTYDFTSGATNGFGRFELLFNPPITAFPAIALVSNSMTVAANATSVNLAYSGTTL
jgi:hypothetical protein